MTTLNSGRSGVERFGDWDFVPASASDDGAVFAVTQGVSGDDLYDPPMLVARSQWSPSSGDSLDLYVNFPERCIIGNNAGAVAVEWALRPARIGQANQPWHVSISNDAVFTGQPRELIQHLVDNSASVFSVVLVDDYGDGYDARFSLNGAPEALSRVMESAN